MSSLPLLYSFRRCPYAIRARWTLACCGLQWEHREVVLKNKPAHMLELSPKGTVPVLQLPDGTVLEESLDIILWALEQQDPMQLDVPANEHENFLSWVARNDGEFKSALDRYKYATRYEDQDPLSARDNACEFVSDAESRLKNQPFLLGDRFTVIDLATMPFIRQFGRVDEDWFEKTFPIVTQWWLRLEQTPKFLQIMRKLPPWEEGARPTILMQSD